ncbi:elongation factor Tu GTP binding domain-containing protein [Pseudomassariella vexata]|uniref:Elongation factor Tu GTP binding domain-containing protein n=1 Tax=Pseudomassariella vexata TaxID=1141098 RepID=A0A1Y2DU70_9PEZI|nr:elongation factor Tu GTP binding domain-containing protein [Pseudomassariella vexata]ORY62185.1 elongation factor Tu GTP binding domain-containing protein [Pseudomassariella vexata]
MTSIFTFDDNPPRVSSPWLASEETAKKSASEATDQVGYGNESVQANEPKLYRLEAEPQEGPIEYKLHLLLRARRAYAFMSTTSKGSGSPQSNSARPMKSTRPTNVPLASSAQTRQNRLQQLTTQLLWRLQQSSPHHSTGKGQLVIPKLPEDSDDMEDLVKPQQLLPGLEESNGALYEIGVSDDGTFVGLTKEEMDESMTTLKVMAASLGCRVEVQRMKTVGNCEWVESSGSKGIPIGKVLQGDLWVAEALVTPILEPQKDQDAVSAQGSLPNGSLTPVPERRASKTEQLRVSLIGPTTSGKTTLLGTLANGTLDNGRGSSRIDLLKHRHERVSGQTSSVAQELIGYKDNRIFNYVGMGINTWTDIHDHSEDGRLVFFSDSAGHLRYRRTILRGLVGWAPHWTLLCIAGNEIAGASRGAHSLSGTPDDLDLAGAADLAMSHLDLCVRLEIPMVIVITKYDLATKVTLRSTLSSIFSKIKAAQRTPKLLVSTQTDSADLTHIPPTSQEKVTMEITDAIQRSGNMLSVVPVVLTSAVSGQGIGLTHALLRSLPMPPPPTARDYVGQALNPEQPASLFHIDDKFDLKSFRTQDSSIHGADGSATVVAGYLRFGRLSIGDKVVFGPFPAEEDEDVRGLVPRDHPSPGRGLSLSHPWAARNAVSASTIHGEWHNATIMNIRNLRLPVRTMEAGQAGTIQVAFDEPFEETSGIDDALFERVKPSSRHIRKGQVLAIPSQHMLDTGLTLQAATGFTATFNDMNVKSLQIGNLVNVYVATVRAAARILHIVRQHSRLDTRRVASEDHDDVFNMADSIDLGRAQSEADVDDFDIEYTVSLELMTSREWIELGSRVVLMEGGSKDGSGLDGFVGKVTEVVG